MKTKVLAIAFSVALGSMSGVASAKGCLAGAAVGGIGGHVAGHHGLLGAAAGCAVGHYAAKKRDQRAARRAPASLPAPAQGSVGRY